MTGTSATVENESLEDFLVDNQVSDTTAEIYPSERFRKAGKPFTIKAMTNARMKEYRRQTSHRLKNGQRDDDPIAFNVAIAIGQTVKPNLRSKELIDRLHAGSPENAIELILLPGEIAEISNQVMNLSGFGDDDVNDGETPEKLVERAKN